MLRTLAFIAAITVSSVAFAEDKIPVSNSNLYQKVADGEVAPQATEASKSNGAMHPSAYAKPSTKPSKKIAKKKAVKKQTEAKKSAPASEPAATESVLAPAASESVLSEPAN